MLKEERQKKTRIEIMFMEKNKKSGQKKTKKNLTNNFNENVEVRKVYVFAKTTNIG